MSDYKKFTALTLLPGLALSRATQLCEGLGSALTPLFPMLRLNLKHADIRMQPAAYLAASLVSSLAFFFATGVLAYAGALLLSLEPALLMALLLGILFGLLVFLQNAFLPAALVAAKVRSIEQNLMPALSDMVVQLNAGIPLFQVMAAIAAGNYGMVSSEFKRAVRMISTGESQTAVLEELATANPSVLFRRVVWQLANSLKTGASIHSVLADAISHLSDEQVIQIQHYGGLLNGLTMLYMLAAVIAPALFLAAVVVASFFFSLTQFWILLGFVLAYLAILFLQVLFLGLLRTRRPNLL